MVEFRGIAINYGTQQVLENVTLRVNAGERVGIVGPNGAGKSTLFQLITGSRQPDKGEVVLEGRPTVGYVRQHLAPAHDDETLLEYAMRGVPRLHDLEAEIHALQAALETAGENRDRLLRELGGRQTEFEHLGGYDLEARVKTALGGLGFSNDDMQKPFRVFSGGWQMRAELTRVLASIPGLLLLDEPSNYLDLPAVEWLQRFLKSYEGTLLLISHDRYLLRSLTDITVEIDACTATRYNGPLDFYLRERDLRTEQLVQAKANVDRERERLQRFVDRFKATATKAAQAASRVKQIERLEDIRLPKRSQAAAHLRIAPPPHCGAEVVRLENAAFSYDGSRNIFEHLDLSLGRGDKLAIVGYNGMGKTTLLRLIAGTRAPTTGTATLGHHVQPGYLSQEFAETIPPEITVLEAAKRAAPNLPERDLRTQLGSFGFGADDLIKPTGVLSGGEKIRLAFLRLFLAPPNLLILDEPTTHLDLEGRAALERALSTYPGTVCIVSHDVEFVRAVATTILEITPGATRFFHGNYDYYREKTREKEVQESRSSGVQNGEASSPRSKNQSSSSPPSAISSKDLRRAKAALREKHLPAIRKVRARVEELENEITKLEAKERELAAELAAPPEGYDYAAASKSLHAARHQLHVLALEWEERSTALSGLEKKLAEEEQLLELA
ncbi:MAG: ABC-F family ATP-binding cassette domain-containing protein [Kiritimatiellaeota bacterium]|nr:ABC-F family ATP-binding cassette domain-containing protein [Kiritimatiellota bacterium]